MRFAERAAVSLVRPIYRSFLERPLWWFLARIKAFFFAEVSVQTSEVLSRLGEIERRLQVLEGQLQGADRHNTAQWEGLEQLVLAILRQPGSPATSSGWEPPQSAHPARASELKLNGVNESNNIR